MSDLTTSAIEDVGAKSSRQTDKQGSWHYRCQKSRKATWCQFDKAKRLHAIPAIGALFGASVNGWYIKEVGWAARRAFQERCLLENHKIIETK